jgi:ankyrin repeat protein
MSKILWSYLALSLLSYQSIASEIHNICRIPESNTVERVKALIVADPAIVNLKDAGGATPLSYAAMRGSRELIQLLITNKSDVNSRDKYNSTPLHKAAVGHNLGAIELLIAAGAKVDAQDDVTATPLYDCVRSKNPTNRLAVAKYLIEHGADPNAVRSPSALEFANSWKDTELVDYLKSRGAK